VSHGGSDTTDKLDLQRNQEIAAAECRALMQQEKLPVVVIDSEYNLIFR
jgi:hypothetical protein